jgi:NOL1/NOP2/fmu family ribosome biogenesis protein
MIRSGRKDVEGKAFGSRLKTNIPKDLKFKE